MIISKTPFRMPLGGGGTDLPSYYSKYGGFFISGAINKYMHIVLNDRFEEGIRVSYSKTEIVKDPEKIVHPSVREALKLLKFSDRIEIVSLADIPTSTGLGSSGSFTVGLLNALYAHQRIVRTPEEIAEAACDIAMNRLHEPSGKQDEYIASLGGIKAFEVDTAGKVTSTDLRLSEETLAELEGGLMMFYTGIQRSASQVLTKQQQNVSTNKDNATEKMHRIKTIGIESRKALETGDIMRFGELLHEHWVEKRGVTDGMTTDSIDQWYSIARKHGALGGKVCFVPETTITTENGYKAIKDVQQGDRVIDHRGRPETVLEVMKRYYDGKILEFSVKGLNNKIRVTPEHPIFTTIKHPLNQREENRKIVNLPLFKEAKDFRKGDVLLVPVDTTEENIEFISLERTITQSRYSNRDIYESIPRELILDYDLLNLIGWYAAEGSRSRKQFFFTLNKDESLIAEEIVENLSRLFSKEAVIVPIKTGGGTTATNAIYVRCSSVVISKFFEDLCGESAANKHLPSFVMRLPRDKQFIVLRALWRGDGCLRNVIDKRYGGRYGVCVFKTVSFTLAKQVQQLCLRLGFVCGIRTEKGSDEEIYIYKNKRPTTKRLAVYGITIHGDDAVAFTESIKTGKLTPVLRRNNKHLSLSKDFVKIEGATYAKRSIVRIEEKEYEGEVFNLEVDGTHTYVAEDIAVHNCGAGGGGFLLICAQDHRHEIRAALAKEGLVEHRFRFDFEGSKVVYNN